MEFLIEISLYLFPSRVIHYFNVVFTPPLTAISFTFGTFKAGLTSPNIEVLKSLGTVAVVRPKDG